MGTTVEEEKEHSDETEVEVRVPDMGFGDGSNERYRVMEWFKKEGDVVHRGDVLCDVETPDFTYGMETDDEHDTVIGRIFVDAPSDYLREGDVICTLLHHKKHAQAGYDGGDAEEDSEKEDDGSNSSKTGKEK